MANELPESTPKVTNNNVIKPEDVRHFIMDRSVEDNALHLDLYFDEGEILKAMRYAAMEFNSIPPFVINVNPENMPAHIAFLYGITYHLYLAKLQQLGRNDITYNAGGVTTTLVKDQVEFLTSMLPMYKQEFTTLSKQIKLKTNISNSFGVFC